MAKLRKHMCLMWKVERSMSLISGMHDNAYTVHSQWVIRAGYFYLNLMLYMRTSLLLRTLKKF